MTTETLYEALARPVTKRAGVDPGRTEQTATRETVDNDFVRSSLYAHIGVEVVHQGPDRGRTEETKAGGETVDRDRHVPASYSQLLGAGEDLYGTLGIGASSAAADCGRTEITEATETIDWDRPPIGPGT